MYGVYILRGLTQQLNVGVHLIILLRIKRHRSGDGAEFAKCIRNFNLVNRELFNALREVRERERQIKAWR
jgi:predicted GIY-YIG superfamily endonuclease